VGQVVAISIYNSYKNTGGANMQQKLRTCTIYIYFLKKILYTFCVLLFTAKTLLERLFH